MPTNHTLNWADASANGDYTVGSGSTALDVSITTSATAGGQTASVQDQGSPTENALWVNDLTDAVTTELAFAQPVQDLSFEILDLDQNGTDWDERVTILATDAEGNVFPVSYSDLAGTHSASGNSADTSGSSSLTTDTSGGADSITVTIAGPITSLEVIFEPGESATQTGALGLSDISFSAAPDGIVEGTAGNDLIDGDYLDDPHGEHATDNDDTIHAGDGDDTINAGDGDDYVIAGDGNDSVELSDGNDRFEGGDGDDSVNGDYGNDELHGGAGNDFLRGSFGNDTIHSGGAGEGDDYLWGGYGDDTFVIQDGFGNDTISAEDQDEVNGDTLDLSAVTTGVTLDLTNAHVGLGSFSYGTDTAQYESIENIELSSGQDTLLLADGSGNDTVSGFAAPTDNGDGTYSAQDKLDVSRLTSDYGTTPITTRDVSVTEDADGNAILTFPGGETLTLKGVSSDAVSDPAMLEAMGIPAAPDGYVTGTDGNDTLNVGDIDGDGDYIDVGDAVLPGSSGDDDHIRTLDGDDLVNAGLGNDIIEAGRGNDTVFASFGNDTLYAGEGNDELHGEDGNDVFYSDEGHNSLYGGSGDDQFFDVSAGDNISGGSGNDTLDLTGSGPHTITYSSSDSTSGSIDFLDGDGNITGSATFKDIETVVPCFTPGTLIATDRGQIDVCDLAVGDLVCTRDHGLQPIQWIGRRDLSETDLAAAPHLRGVIIREGALGDGLPSQDMTVSPNHRLLIADPKVELLFGDPEVLVAAKHMVGLPGIERSTLRTISYVHLMFRSHEIVCSDQIWSESFQPGQQAIAGLDVAQRDEIFTLFPQLKTMPSLVFQTARRVAQKHETKLLF